MWEITGSGKETSDELIAPAKEGPTLPVSHRYPVNNTWEKQGKASDGIVNQY